VDSSSAPGESNSDSPHKAFQDVIAIAGSQGEAGKWVGVSQQAIGKRLRAKKGCAPEWALQFERKTGISRHRLAPDFYPIEDASHPATLAALPPNLACDRPGKVQLGEPVR
jgi:DNA-binding transcriptional regulator YdaS (Cro superfamily)